MVAGGLLVVLGRAGIHHSRHCGSEPSEKCLQQRVHGPREGNTYSQLQHPFNSTHKSELMFKLTTNRKANAAVPSAGASANTPDSKPWISQSLGLG